MSFMTTCLKGNFFPAKLIRVGDLGQSLPMSTPVLKGPPRRMV